MLQVSWGPLVFKRPKWQDNFWTVFWFPICTFQPSITFTLYHYHIEYFFVMMHSISILFKVYKNLTVRLPLQSATPPHWANSPMAVRAIPASARRRTARRLPNRIQIMFWRAATFIQLLAWVDIKMHKAVEAWKQKKAHINNMYTLHIFI